ncbi:unnamed protein product [Linum trigynum]|uniref:Uncharacterized protein n=1 Tax=Linum trigynum TaxID=586398 RepID=A0AAV2E8K9_9ROSI
MTKQSTDILLSICFLSPSRYTCISPQSLSSSFYLKLTQFSLLISRSGKGKERRRATTATTKGKTTNDSDNGGNHGGEEVKSRRHSGFAGNVGNSENYSWEILLGKFFGNLRFGFDVRLLDSRWKRLRGNFVFSKARLGRGLV